MTDLMGWFMTQTKTDGNSVNSLKPGEQPFNNELFEKKYFELLENDPEHWVCRFQFHYLDSVDPQNVRGKAHIAMISAKQKIRELMEEIERQEAIVCTSKRTIQKIKRQGQEMQAHEQVQGHEQVQVEKIIRRGRPARSEHKEEVVKKFMMKWVESLKDALDVKSCGAEGGLEKLVSSTLERSWRRWLKGDAIPSYATFENLLESKITEGKYAGEHLRNVPVTPTHTQMLMLLQFI